MKLLYLTDVYLIINSAFSVYCIAIISFSKEVTIVELIIFTIGSYWANILTIINSTIIQIKHRR